MSVTNPLLAALAGMADAARPHVIFVFDLHSAPPVVYSRLDAELVKLKYRKVREDTTWERIYEEGVDRDAAVAQTKREFGECARRAGAASYDVRIYGAAARMKIDSDSKR